ncbi:hypothetical protein J7E63_15010 [Bacillus sp. ISL-75]|uniref:hypothetical protein n=1 Tax=Bacillus sp. ISL-75 TaxID=2819137 RepID=UPI001BE8491F|nr:hypothetical protein [Bacillus sp. ISL-75]MBT2728245.1 hypothetical protein [Bacillus sp. ISL-75]
MLQIISGKFFSGNRVVHNYNSKGILYSNYSWHGPIETVIATLEPADIHGNVKGYVMSYVNKLESEENTSFSLVKTGDSEIVRQFQVLCTFGLGAYFDHDKNSVELNCREKSRGMGDEYIPTQLVSRFFDREISGTPAEIEYFSNFVQKVINLKREDYKNIMTCLKNFSDSLEVMNYNIDLAYTMLIYSMEALSKKYNDYTPVWDDYDQSVRKELETYFSSLDATSTEAIKHTLVKSSHLKLQKNFIDFICNNVSDSFFEIESNDINSALKKSDLKRALKNAYFLRSGYVHELKTILKQLKIPNIAKGDVFRWQKEPYLTFSGLIRVIRHVVNNFIWKLDYVESEEYDWRNDLPGMFFLEMDPKLWVWKHEGFELGHATFKFTGFLSQVDEAMISQEPLNDLKLLLERFEEQFPQAKKEDKITMFCMYVLYCSMVSEEYRPSNCDSFIEKNQDFSEVCCIETMVSYLLLDQDWPWDLKSCIKAYENYNVRRFSKNSLKLPNTQEIGVLCQIGNLTGTSDSSSRISWY